MGHRSAPTGRPEQEGTGLRVAKGKGPGHGQGLWVPRSSHPPGKGAEVFVHEPLQASG